MVSRRQGVIGLPSRQIIMIFIWPPLYLIFCDFPSSDTFLRSENHLALGLVSFAKTRPTMKACMRHPDIDWSDMTTIAAVHSLVVCIEQGVVI